MRFEKVAIVAILVVGAVLRCAYLYEIRDDPGLAHPAVDNGFNLYWARGLDTDDWTLPPDSVGRDPQIQTTAYQRPPGYPYVLAVLHRLTGGGPLAIRGLQLTGGLLAVFLAWRLGRRLVDPATGLIWAGCMAVHWGFIYFGAGLNGMWLVIILGFVLIDMCHRLVCFGRPAYAAAIGVLVGLVVLVRTNALLTAPLLGVWMILALRRRFGIQRAAASLAITALAGILTLTPSTVRNLRVSGHFVPVSANGGLTLFHGNNPSATGFSTAAADEGGVFSSPWHAADLMARTSADIDRPVDFVEMSQYFGRKALRWMTEHPYEALRLVGLRAALFWGPHEIAHSTPVAADRQASPLLRHLPFSFSLALAAGLWGIGLLVLRPTRRPLPDGVSETLWAGAVIILGWFISFLPFFVTSLYRLPVLVVLLFGAAAGVVRTGLLLRSKHLFVPFVGLVGAALLWWLTTIPIVSVNAGQLERHILRGVQWRSQGDLRQAENEFIRALEISPGSGSAANALGSVYLDLGRTADAMPLFETAVRANSGNPNYQFNLGLAYASLGRWTEAVTPLSRAVKLAPNLAEAQALFGVACDAGNDLAGASSGYEAALAIRPGDLQVANNLAWLLATAPDAHLRDGNRAVQLARRCVAAQFSPPVLGTLAAALAETGDYEEAVSTLEQAIQLNRSEQILPEEDLTQRLELYRAGKPYRRPMMLEGTTPPK